MIKSIKYSNLSPADADELQQCIHAAFGHVPFVQNHTWAQPDWTFIKYENGRVATFYNVVLRDVSIDGKKYKVAGVNNVITPEEFRGRGFASEILRATEQYLFNDLGCKYGLLLCADALLPFYTRLGWYKVHPTLYYDQPTGRQLYDSNVMLLSSEEQPFIKPESIDLNGLPW
ncbi:putative N-acetyltransferase YhbS [Pontibacter aydingkolensis]|uniref:GNAT family N-acetyltransferase n=1 Tax=Pontibacter aydingkolensis TaxID=1911536 RepID=A0ABS7CYB7_9BACT|nr:GNAT family N-acetyltransferase [Pontibacter aydingkolensis]MBW7468805.1 GNAT family N-acetyltransferase [Pontibacter aydingkolensis]